MNNERDILVSFAQNNEDTILYHIFKDDSNIFWIDVGANDQEYLSVTKLFYDKGYRGINIEPQKKYLQQYYEKRKDDISLCAGLGSESGTLKLYGYGTGASFEKEMVLADTFEEVPIVTLKEVCDKYLKEEKISFLKIDVEGFEKKVLLGADLVKYRPKVILMEAAIPNTEIPNYDEWEYILTENNYFFVKQHGVNRFYLAKEESKYLEKFNEIDDLENHYLIYNNCILLKEIERLTAERDSYKKSFESVQQSITFRVECKLINLFKGKKDKKI